jgi:cell division protein FtsB
MVWSQLRHQIAEVKTTAKKVAAERHRLENRVRLLHPASLDPDMLDERARLMLNFGHPDEIIIIDQQLAKDYVPERTFP